LDLGLSASLTQAALGLDYAQHITSTPIGDLSAFATASAGLSREGGRWVPGLSALGGLRLRW